MFDHYRAMGCEKNIARQIVDGGSDYLLSVKSNRGEKIKDVFACGERDGFDRIGYHEQVSKGHGRLERRKCWVITELAELSYVDPGGQWAGLRSVAKVSYQREADSEQSEDTCYYICSYTAQPLSLLKVVRSHWSIENGLHWVLDMAFDEDHSRVRAGHADHNLAIARHLVLNLLKQDTISKIGIKAKRKKAGWDYDYLLKIISH